MMDTKHTVSYLEFLDRLRFEEHVQVVISLFLHLLSRFQTLL